MNVYVYILQVTTRKQDNHLKYCIKNKHFQNISTEFCRNVKQMLNVWL